MTAAIIASLAAGVLAYFITMHVMRQRRAFRASKNVVKFTWVEDVWHAECADGTEYRSDKRSWFRWADGKYAGYDIDSLLCDQLTIHKRLAQWGRE
jgi:hypothetical protein